MVLTVRRGLLAIFLLSWMVEVSEAQTPAAADTSATAEVESHVTATDERSLTRIREALARGPVLMIRQPTFRTGITERRPRSFDLTEYTKPVAEPPTWNAGWHNEFLTMVTPPEFRTWQAFTNTDLLQLSATSLAAALVGKALGAISDWRQNAREAEARKEVDRALAEFLATKAGATPEIVSPR